MIYVQSKNLIQLPSKSLLQKFNSFATAINGGRKQRHVAIGGSRREEKKGGEVAVNANLIWANQI